MLRILTGCAKRRGRIPAVVFDRSATKLSPRARARRPEGCDENGPAAALLLSHVSIPTCLRTNIRGSTLGSAGVRACALAYKFP